MTVALKGASSSHGSIPGQPEAQTRRCRPPRRARTQQSASTQVNASSLLARRCFPLSSAQINPIFGRIVATCIHRHMQSDRSVPAYALCGACLTRGKVVEISSVSFLPRRVAAGTCSFPAKPLSASCMERPASNSGGGFRKAVSSFGVTSRSSPLSAGPQAAVSMSFQLAVPPFMPRRHDPSRGESDGAQRLRHIVGWSFDLRLNLRHPQPERPRGAVVSSSGLECFARSERTERSRTKGAQSSFEDQ